MIIRKPQKRGECEGCCNGQKEPQVKQGARCGDSSLQVVNLKEMSQGLQEMFESFSDK